MTPVILYQDEDLLVLDKPPGMVVNNAESVKGETVQDWIIKEFPNLFCHRDPDVSSGEAIPIIEIASSSASLRTPRNDIESDFCSRAGIVHRIDKETSGILLIAKTPAAFGELQRQFKEREVKKTYLALVHGNIPEEGTINAPVGRLPWNREHFGVVPGGKESVTKFKRISIIDMTYARSGVSIPGIKEAPIPGMMRTSEQKMFSLVEVYPETGRTHQIRVHFKYLGYPLVGDYLYGGRIQSRDDRKEFPRVMLHAWKIAFAHPTTHEPLAFEALIPDDMNTIIKQQITSTKSQTNSNNQM